MFTVFHDAFARLWISDAPRRCSAWRAIASSYGVRSGPHRDRLRIHLHASERVTWDACRWGMEVWQRILKSGWRLAERQLATGERVRRCLTLYSVMAWRVLYALMLARAVPEMSCDVVLESEAWQALSCAIHYCPTPPASPPALDQAVRWSAQLGGFVGRRRDQPGAETLWRGFQHVTDLTRRYRIMRSAPP